MKIYIDPGHGGSSIGASFKGRREQDDTLRLSLAVREILLENKDVEVKLSRTGNENPSLEERAAEANKWGADYFISIHRNALSPNTARGAEVWIYSEAEAGGVTYNKAKRILDLVCSASGFRNRGVKKGAPSYRDFAVNRLTDMSSCLFEAGFIDSDEDNKLFDGSFTEIANALADGLLEAVGLSSSEGSENASDNESTDTESVKGVIYLVQTGAFINRKNAEVQLKEVKAKGFSEAFIAIKGDMDGDGRLTAADARELLRKSVGKEGE